MAKKKYSGSVISFRSDRLGARLMALMNTIRIAVDYDLPYFFVWKIDERTSEELVAPTDIFDQEYFDQHFIPEEDFRKEVPGTAELQLFEKGSTEKDLYALVKKGKPLLCQAFRLMVLPWESPVKVAPKYAAALHKVRFNPVVRTAMEKVDETLSDKGIAFHIRRGDIIYDDVASNQLWQNKYIPSDFYHVLAQELLKKPDTQILAFSDEPEEVKRLQELGPRVLAAAELVPQGLTPGQRDFIELYAMSRCQQIFGPPSSGFSLTAGLLGNRPVKDVRNALSKESRKLALENLCTRLRTDLSSFLNDGDVGQCLPFALDYLNAQGRRQEGLEILQPLAEKGYSKLFFFGLYISQNTLAGRPPISEKVLEDFSAAQIDTSWPRRVEQHWGEAHLMAAIGWANAGDRAAATRDMTLALWYAPAAHRAIVSFSQLYSTGVIDPATFPIPFDAEITRPLPTNAGIRMDKVSLLSSEVEHENRRIPSDLMARDWQPFLGKFLGRFFDEPQRIKQSEDRIEKQFAPYISEATAASAMGLYAYSKREFKLAKDKLEFALGAEPENPLWIKRLAMVKYAIDPKDKDAIKLLQKAVEIGAPNGLYSAQLALVLWDERQRQDAIDIMRGVCDQGTLIPELPFLTARMMRRARQVGPEALAYIDQALSLAPHVRRYMSFRTNILIAMDEKDAAREAIERIEECFGVTGDLPRLRERLAS